MGHLKDEMKRKYFIIRIRKFHYLFIIRKYSGYEKKVN